MLDDIFSRKARKEFMSFLEKPATPDEENIQSTIRECLFDMNTPEHVHTHEYLTPQAKINSPILKKDNLSIDEIHQLRNELPNALLGVFFDEARIEINTEKSAAKVYGVMTFFIGQARKVNGYIFHLVRSDQRWLISKIEWHKL